MAYPEIKQGKGHSLPEAAPGRTYSSMLRNIHAFFSCNCMRWMRKSAIGSLLAASTIVLVLG